MRYLLPMIAAAGMTTLGMASPAKAQVTGFATLLQSTENCLAWMNNGFPDATPFDGGFDAIVPFPTDGEGIYAEPDTGFQVRITRDGGMALCESHEGTVRLGPGGLDELRTQMRGRINSGRAVRAEPGRYLLCAGPAGLLTVLETDEAEQVGFRIEFGTDAALDQAGGC